MGKADRQQQRLRQLAVSHLHIASSHLDQAKHCIKNGLGSAASEHLAKATNSIQGAHDAIPLSDMPVDGGSHLSGTASSSQESATAVASRPQDEPEVVAQG
jgi:hypothetical protein